MGLFRSSQQMLTPAQSLQKALRENQKQLADAQRDLATAQRDLLKGFHSVNEQRALYGLAEANDEISRLMEESRLLSQMRKAQATPRCLGPENHTEDCPHCGFVAPRETKMPWTVEEEFTDAPIELSGVVEPTEPTEPPKSTVDSEGEPTAESTPETTSPGPLLQSGWSGFSWSGR